MPYIKNTDRSRLDPLINSVRQNQIETAGELNYAITCMIIEYFKSNNNYQGINDIVGALEGAKMEFYRRAVAPYEDNKIDENGDVY